MSHYVNVLEVIGYESSIRPSKHRSARILKKLMKREVMVPIYSDKPKILRLSSAMMKAIINLK